MGVVLDFTGGVSDIRSRMLQTVIPAEKSFREDPARALRAVRFAARLDFEPGIDLVNAARWGEIDVSPPFTTESWHTRPSPPTHTDTRPIR